MTRRRRIISPPACPLVGPPLPGWVACTPGPRPHWHPTGGRARLPGCILAIPSRRSRRPGLDEHHTLASRALRLGDVPVGRPGPGMTDVTSPRARRCGMAARRPAAPQPRELCAAAEQLEGPEGSTVTACGSGLLVLQGFGKPDSESDRRSPARTRTRPAGCQCRGSACPESRSRLSPVQPIKSDSDRHCKPRHRDLHGARDGDGHGSDSDVTVACRDSPGRRVATPADDGPAAARVAVMSESRSLARRQ